MPRPFDSVSCVIWELVLRVAAVKAGMLDMWENPSSPQEKLGVGSYLTIVRHCANSRVYDMSESQLFLPISM